MSATKSSPGFATRESLVTPVNALAAPGRSPFRQSLSALRTSSIVNTSNTSSSQRVVLWLTPIFTRVMKVGSPIGAKPTHAAMVESMVESSASPVGMESSVVPVLPPTGYALEHIVGISKTTYVPATPRSLDWRHDLPRTSTNNDPSDAQDPCRRPARRHRGDRRSPRLPGAGVLVVDGRVTH